MTSRSWPSTEAEQGGMIMDTEALTHPTDPEIATRALAEAAAATGYAPSIHNTQPWRWRLTADTLELRLVRSRILPVTDPEGRLATLSCGAALHHAHVALAAQGWQATITRMPLDDDPDLLAHLHVDSRTPIDPASVLQLRTIPFRHTDRRPVTGTPVDAADLAAITTAVQAQDTQMHALRPDQILELAAAADHAQRSEAADPAWQAELAYWTGLHRPAGAGVQDADIPARATSTTVPGRDFGHHGDLPISAEQVARRRGAVSRVAHRHRTRRLRPAAQRPDRGHRRPAGDASDDRQHRIPLPGTAPRHHRPGRPGPFTYLTATRRTDHRPRLNRPAADQSRRLRRRSSTPSGIKASALVAGASSHRYSLCAPGGGGAYSG
jgi:nitroreductase